MYTSLISTFNVQIILFPLFEALHHIGRTALPILPFVSLAPILLKATLDLGAFAIISLSFFRISNRHP